MIGLSIEITDDGSVCTSRYQVEYRKVTDAGYTQAPDAFESPIEIYNLQESTEYVIRITRTCCNGNVNTPLTFNRITGSSSLEAPENFVATAYAGEEIELTWDNDPAAETYVIDRATDAGFTTALTEVYNAAYGTGTYLDAPLTATVTYYYRIRSTKTSFPDSPYSYDNATAFA